MSDETQQEETQSNTPERYIAIFLDDESEVQVGAVNMADNDLVVWEHMMSIALEKIRFQQYVHARYVRSQEIRKRQGGGLIVPQ